MTCKRTHSIRIVCAAAAVFVPLLLAPLAAQAQPHATPTPAAAVPSVPGSVARVGGVPASTLIRYESVNQGEPWGGGDKLAIPRQIAAAIVAVDTPSPKMIVDVGSHSGEFLEAFLDEFPAAHAQWTEPVDNNLENAKKRFARFGKRVDYKIGCPGRDLADNCVPANVDVLITAWVSAHRDPAGITKYYQDAAKLVPSGGWIVNLDHVAPKSAAWEERLMTARLKFHAVLEGPSAHPGSVIAPLEVHLKALKDAGLDDAEVVWRSFNTVLIMARKK